ncbi:hypothetical protein HO173_009013 [Letharia columbiana]|uniref:NAD(P)-binding protein n=1 Tax=Letharia columbiana TaxID=112416 RepID=A0A8H6FQE4_9LECA|nr:uncharacterized protein HO173_009013 [Letharia columbiana]KAF6232799.1 hypothetical protein HO173_009013 [Letharia columbiana]
MPSPVILLLGAGANIGHGIAQRFSSSGYKVAIASRSGKSARGTDYLSVKADLTQPQDVKSVFDTVKSELGIPSVVVYIAYGLTMAAESNPLSPPLEKLTSDLAINTVSAFAAAQEAVKGFEELGSSAPKTFIQIGNMLNKMVYPRLITMGIGKQAAAHTIAGCAEAYGGKGWHFYYVDERRENGQPAMGRDRWTRSRRVLRRACARTPNTHPVPTPTNKDLPRALHNPDTRPPPPYGPPNPNPATASPEIRPIRRLLPDRNPVSRTYTHCLVSIPPSYQDPYKHILETHPPSLSRETHPRYARSGKERRESNTPPKTHQTHTSRPSSSSSPPSTHTAATPPMPDPTRSLGGVVRSPPRLPHPRAPVRRAGRSKISCPDRSMWRRCGGGGGGRDRRGMDGGLRGRDGGAAGALGC